MTNRSPVEIELKVLVCALSALRELVEAQVRRGYGRKGRNPEVGDDNEIFGQFAQGGHRAILRPLGEHAAETNQS